MTHAPRRIVLILPCCIGDVVLATATLCAVRRAYPDAHITWAVGTWAREVVERHPDLDATLDTGPAALPVKTITGFWRFIRQLRAGKFDLAISLVRSPLMSLAVRFSGISTRAGLDSGGRGFGYTVKARIDPDAERHEAEIYLDVVRALGHDPTGCIANVPVNPDDFVAARDVLKALEVPSPFVVVNPAGGSNPGMTLDVKRYPPDHMAVIIRGLQSAGLAVILAAGPDDGVIVAAVQREIEQKLPLPSLAGLLTLRQIGALAALSHVYIGNDTGLTHLAAASGARTVMLMGPSSPKRYAPFSPNSLVLWKPTAVPARGVAAGTAHNWDWDRDGIAAPDALAKILKFVER